MFEKANKHSYAATQRVYGIRKKRFHYNQAIWGPAWSGHDLASSSRRKNPVSEPGKQPLV